MSRPLYAGVIALLLLILFSAAAYAQSGSVQEKLTNRDLIEMTQSNLPEAIIIAKIKSSGGNFDVTPAALAELKKARVSDTVILEILAPPTTPNKPLRIKDELTSNFNRLKTSVVTVWSEFGHGTGFIIDREGLILTNQHVVGPSEYIAVQFDEKRKIPAKLLAASPEKDIAVLWVNLEALPDATIAAIARTDQMEAAVSEGERVFTIGSPLNQTKIITTGIASKIEPKAILSDININHGNSGGALFNSIGEVVGVTTFKDLDNAGGVSGIVRIEEALPIIEEARLAMGKSTKPEARLLAVDPADTFPLAAIKEVAEAKKFDTSRYLFGMGDYTVTLMTPTLKYRMETEAEREAAKSRGKRNKKEGAVQGTFRPFEDIRGWREYVGDYKPILLIRATPLLAESFWGAVGRGMAANYGIRVAAKLRFKTDFYKMRLMCGDREVEPIHPAKIAHILNENNYLVSIKDATYEGFYSYPADAINSSCGKVTLSLYSEKKPIEAKIKVLDEKTINKIAEDFSPYLSARKQ